MKSLWIIVFITSLILFFGCKQNTSVKHDLRMGDMEISKDSVSKKYYTKDVSKDFSSFLNNPQNYSSRAAENEESENSVFIEMWNNLTEDEKEMLINNADRIEVSKDFLLSIENDTPIGRAVLSGDTTEIDLVAAVYSFNEWLIDYFGNIKVDLSLLGKEFNDYTELVPVNLAIDYFSKLARWDDVENILNLINSEITVKEIQAKYNELEAILDSSQDDISINRASATVDYQDNPIRENVGLSLKDGTIMLTCFKKKAYPIIGGEWAHAGIFSEDVFYKNGREDSVHCVYTAQPNGYSELPDYMQPDRTNRCCLDYICMYSYQKRMATMIPLNYTSSKAETAVTYAKETFYDDENETVYHIPISEYFNIGDTSHDMTVKNPYCSKVVYSAWKEAGIDLDSNSFGGHLVTPDDLYGSAYNWYTTYTLKFLFWKKTWKVQTFYKSSKILTNESQ